MIDILDVPVTVVFGEAVGGTGRDVVQVWEDASGRMRFTAPPERRPFFAAMKYDQLPAQAEGGGAKYKRPRLLGAASQNRS